MLASPAGQSDPRKNGDPPEVDASFRREAGQIPSPLGELALNDSDFRIAPEGPKPLRLAG
jgi:hypothetical protein